MLALEFDSISVITGNIAHPASDLLISKQEALFWAIKQAKEGLACLLVYCLYIVNLAVAVVGDRPLVSALISSA